MPTPQETIWDRDPHTAAKHDMLTRYLAAWFPIIAKGFPSRGLTYVDAFAGPGEYKNGSEGSPLLALRQAYRSDVRATGSRIRMVFIEKRNDRYRNLVRLIEERFPEGRRPATHLVRIHPGDCRTLLTPAISEARSWETPMFVNLDGWGTDTPYSLVHQLGRQDHAEVLITFARDWSMRDRHRDEDPHRLDQFYGEPDVWRRMADAGTSLQAKASLLNYYLGRLREAGFPYQLMFELVDEGGHELLLIYATKSELGIERMKDAMWQVDPVYGQRFRDPRDENQLSLDISEAPDLSLLKRQLLDKVTAAGSILLSELKRYTLLQTIYREPHATTAVRELDAEMKVSVVWRRSHEDTIVSSTLFAG